MNGALKAPLFLIFLGVMAVLGYSFWKATYRDLMDAVYDCGDYLVVKKSGQEDTVLLSNINNVRFSTDGRGVSARITLCLDAPGKFGQEIAFAPPQIYFGTPRNDIASELLARVDGVRAHRPADSR